MANNSATIVAAALDSTQLEQSINKLVSTVASKTKEMADNFTSEIARMEQAVKNLGNIKIDSGGSADGGSSRRTKMLSEESLKAKEVTMTYDQMQAAFQRIAKDNSGLKDIRTFNKEELQSYIDLLRKLQAEYVRVNTQEGGGAKSDQIKRDMNELEKIIQGYQTILRNVEAINSRQGTIDVKKWTQDIGAVDDRYKKLVRWYTVLEKEDQRRIANEEKANQKRLAELDKEEKARQKMIESARKAEEKYQENALKNAWRNALRTPTDNIDQAAAKIERLKSLINSLHPIGIISKTDVDVANSMISKLENRFNIQLAQSAQLYTDELKKQKLELDELNAKKRLLLSGGAVSNPKKDEVFVRIEALNQQLSEAQKRLDGLKKMSIISVDDNTKKDFVNGIIREAQRLKSTLDMSKMTLEEILALPSTGNQKLDHYIENVRKLMGAWNSEPIKLAEGRVVSLKREIDELNSKKSAGQKTENNSQQIANIEAQIVAKKKEIAETEEKIASIKNQQINTSQRYTEEIRKQAQAIRESAQWKEKGYAMIGDRVYYDPERSVAPAKNRLSLEEQILNVQKEEEVASIRSASAQRQEAAEKAAIEQETRKVLATEQQITAEQQKRSQPKTFASYDSLRESIAHVLGMQQSQIKLADTETASYNNLSTTLKQLKQAYDRLTASERNSDQGKALVASIHEVERAMQQIRSQATRPISLESLIGINGRGGLSEKTLDDIAYKMRQLASYRSGLNVDTQRNEINQVNTEYDRLKKKMDEVMQKNSQMIASNNALGRSWNYMKNRLAFYFTVGASTQFIKNLIEVRSQYEMNERALGILINSAERGTQIFNELSQMALVSPYTLIELSSAAKQLTAYDIAAKDVVDTTRRLADMAAAVGIPIERLTYALGQIKAYGYLNSRDARMFANAGIPLVKELADHYTRLEGKLVSTADVYDRIKKKAIDYNDVMQVMNEMTDEGGRFYDFQAKMADTLKVQLANLTLAWNNMLNDLGNSQQGILTGGISALKELFLHWQDINRLLTNVAITLGTAKAAQLLLNLALGKGTLETIRKIGSLEGVTAAQYKDVVATASLTKAQAKFLVAINRNNVALRAAIVQTGILTAKEAEAATTSKLWGVNLGVVTRSFKVLGLTGFAALQGLWAGVKSVSAALWSIATNPLFIAMTAIMAVVDAMMYYNQIAEKTAEMNKAIADNAKEASDALGSYLKDTVNIGNRAKAIQGMLSVSEGQKAWDSLREQIELSSDAAGVFVAKLLEEEDINKRVKEGFDVAESIREATNAMAGLNAEALKVSQDSWLWGAFGEGLAEDLEDYIEKVQEGRKNGANIGSKYFAAGEFNEAMKELSAFANDAETIIRDRLGAGVKDAVQLKEAVERIKKEVIAANPQIKGEVKKWFDVEVDRMMAERFEGVYNELSSIQSQFIEHIKRDSGAALRRLSDDILDTSKELDDEVLGAISKAWDKLKNELPAESQDLISKLQKQMDENPLTLRVLLLEAGEKEARDAIQKDYEEHFYDANIGEKPKRPKDVGSLWGDYKGDYNAFAAAQEKHEKEMVEYNQKNAEWEAKRAEQVAKYGEYNKKNGELRKDWAKRVNDSIKAAKEEQTAAQHTIDSLEKELSLEERKTDVRYQQAVADRDAAKVKIKDAEDVYNYEKLYQEEKKKGGGSKKDPLLDALKQEISLVEKLQSDYDKLTKSGSSQADALDTIRGAYGKTIRLLNTQLQSYGLPQIDISQLITGKDPHKALEHFKATLDTLVDKGLLTFERSKELEAVVEKFTLSAKTYDLDKITKGLNSELDRLKEEYELAVSLDADPELGGIFADWMGIDMSDLPRTAQEYADRYTAYLNKYLKDKKSNVELPNLLNITNDDLRAFQEQIGEGGMSQEWVDEITKGVKAVRDVFSKEKENTSKEWNALIEKYGGLQAKILKIYKDNVQQQASIVREFGTNDEQIKALDLISKIKISQDPAQIARLQEELAKVMADVTSRNPVALKTYQATQNEQTSLTSKAYWDDFKDSDLYTMTFEDMANNSTRAIQLIIEKLNELKDKVKEDPASMKALIKSLNDAESELNARNPLAGIIRSIKEMSVASREAKIAQEELRQAEVGVSGAQIAVDNAKAVGDTKELAKANERLAEAKKKRTSAQVKLAQAENKGKKAEKGLKESVQNTVEVFNKISEAANGAAEVFRIFGDDDTADAISEINKGFSAMTTVIMGVFTALLLLKSTNPWLLAISAALGVIVGLVSFLSGSSNKKITKQVEESERAVKRLENSYKKLEYAAEQSFGAAKAGAQQALKANKELQLYELRRQLALEKSRDSKNYDADKILDLQGQIIDLENEIKNFTKDAVNDLLGISSHGDFFEDMISEMIDAFKSGEDAMKVFEDKWSKMIDNMVMKTIVSQVLQQWVNSLESGADEILERYTKSKSDEIEEMNNYMTDLSFIEDDAKAASLIAKRDREEFNRILKELDAEKYTETPSWAFASASELFNETPDIVKQVVAIYKANMKNRMGTLNQELDKASVDATGELIEYYTQAGEEFKTNYLGVILDKIKENWNFGQDSENKLSQLQQGIQSVSETTASALEGYMNGMSQQVYYHSTLLEQIRDAVVGTDSDIQLGVQGQMLLQLQQSYQVQMSIQGILEGVLTPSGQGFRVELLS